MSVLDIFKRRRLKSMRIHEISAVDRPAQEYATAKIIKRRNMERDDLRKLVRTKTEELATDVADVLGSNVENKANVLGKLFDGFDADLIGTIEKRRVAGIETQPTKPISTFGEGALSVDNPASALADMRELIAKMKRRAPWLDAAEIERLILSRAKPATKNHEDNMIETLAKKIVEDGPGGMTEAQFTKLWREECQRDRRADETAEQCFARHYSDPDNYEKRRALDALKGGSHEYYRKQRPPSPEDYYRGVEVAKSAPSAMESFNHLAAQLREADPSLTKEQAFDRVYNDSANLELRRLERMQNRPLTDN